MANGQGKQFNQRLKLLYLLDYLLENTDEDHTVKTPDIVEYLKNKDIPVERRTVVSDLHLLDEYGIQIEYDYKTQGHRIIEREFELHELQLLIDSVQSSKFITKKMATELTQKLKKQTSFYNRTLLERRNYVANRIRSMNDSVFYHIDDIHIAIARNLKIKFKYFNYTPQKQKSYYLNGQFYTVSPYALLWNDDNYYLLAYHGGKMKHFRVDRMDNIRISGEPREGASEFKELKLNERSSKVFSMYSGTQERVSMVFSNHLAGVVFDRFGMEASTFPVDDRHFTLVAEVEVSPQFFGWIVGLGKGVRITAPETVVQQMKEYIDGIAEMYE